jgi:transcriptional regulator with XRE-family HTH domain
MQELFYTFLWEVYFRLMPKKSGLVTAREVEIGQRVKRFRDQINWPQPAFASELGISRDRLASIEYGRTPLRYNVGYRLCFIFDVNHRWLATGEGEIKAATAALELPRAEGQPNRALFSGVCDELYAEKPARRSAGRDRKKPKEGELIPHFDPTAHVVGFLSDLFVKEKFKSPVERQEFALEITKYARELALRIRRERTKDRYLGVSEKSKSDGSTRNVGAVSGLRESIRKLEQEAKKLSAAMEPANSDSITATSLPRSSESEVIRLQDAIDKISTQIGGTEASVKILLSSGKE